MGMKMVSGIKERAQTGDIWEQGAEKYIWT
jgi:hypothetical protein